VLINISNDGWFRFSPQIEQHLATHVFRAVENQMYYVTATNGGFSAIISPYGTIENIGKRRAAEVVVGMAEAEILENPPDWTVYQMFGDGYALVCAIGVLGLVVFAFVERRKSRAKKRVEKNGSASAGGTPP
jgi:apolipoprotein N-acyltransferase